MKPDIKQRYKVWNETGQVSYVVIEGPEEGQEDAIARYVKQSKFIRYEKDKGSTNKDAGSIE